LLRVDNLSKNYGHVKAVKAISFELNKGQIVGFLGANGAGKSTTLKVITGYLSPTTGNVFLDDKNIIDNHFEIQKEIGYLPELNPLYTDMKVHDYLQFHAEIRGIIDNDFREALTRVVKDCGLQGIIHRTVGNCSKGYKQRIGLAAAMIHDPKILILDEPVTGLDPNQIVEIRQLIKKLGQEKIVLMSSHILQEIQATVDRIIIIHDGEIVADGTNDELIENSKGTTKLKMVISDADDESIQNIKATVPSITVQSSVTNEDKMKEIILDYPSTSDPRKDIFQYAVENKWVIYEMAASKNNLESIFRDLTNKQEAVNA
tara:strand:+ start:47 stop:997 length:951 start_codon:yes stop_codon:yes gene_type:complete